MQVVIVGAGNIGQALARTLSKQHSVMMVERDEKRYERIVENLDIGAVNANGANPHVLRSIINDKTHLFLAVTEKDEFNIFACQVAKQVHPGVTTLARVRSPDYLEGELKIDLLNVDMAFSPERLVAAKMKRLAMVENLIDYESLPSLGIDLAVFRIMSDHEAVLHRPLHMIEMPPNCKIVAIHRGNQVRMAHGVEVLEEDDEVTIVGPPEAVEAFDRMLGAKRDPKDIVIVGGGILTEHLLSMLDSSKLTIKLIEKDEARCRRLSRRFDHIVIINDNGSDPMVLRNENVNMADALLCTTDSEEENLLSCLIGKHLGVHKTITNYSRREFENIFMISGVDAAIGYYHVVANEVVKLTVPETEVLLLLEGFREQFFGVRLDRKCRYCDCHLFDIDLPDRSVIAMIVRDGKAEVPNENIMLKEGDLLLIYAFRQDIARLERMFHSHIPIGV